MYRAEVGAFSTKSLPCTEIKRSLAWIEMRTIVAKLIYTYDLKWLNPSMDWHRDSQMHILWLKPQLMVRTIPRKLN
jgi:hypothetical protein